MIPVLVELRAVPAIKALVKILISPDHQPESEVCSCLNIVSASLTEMTRELRDMHGQVSPSLFYHKHRVLLSGWRDNPSLPHGLLYQGVADHPLQFSGGSAAQSSVIQIIDVCLGVEHAEREGEFLVRMRQYMPPNQREMLEELASYPSLRTVCEGREDLQGKYNDCLARLADFRTQHLILVSRVTQKYQSCEFRPGSFTGDARLVTDIKYINKNLHKSIQATPIEFLYFLYLAFTDYYSTPPCITQIAHRTQGIRLFPSFARKIILFPPTRGRPYCFLIHSHCLHLTSSTLNTSKSQ